MSGTRVRLWRTLGRFTPYERYLHLTEDFLRRPLDAEAIERARRSKIRTLVDHAYAHVPYYRELFDREGIDPREIRSPADLERVPVLTKEGLRDNFDRLFSSAFDRDAVVVDSTGGSTGSPTRYAHDRRYIELAQATLMRSMSWSGCEPGALVAWVVGLEAPPGPQERAKRALQRVVNGKLYLNAFDASDASLAAWCREIRRHRPRAFYGYASALTLLARYVAENGVELPAVCAAVTTAEKLYPEQAEAIEKGLGCGVRDFYGCREAFNIAATCGHGRMHSIADMTLLTTDAAGAVTVTPLDNLAMPLLRYQNGDAVEIREESCDCGLALPVIQMKVGRTTDFFVNREGRRIHGEYFTHLMYGVEGVREFQFRQKSVDDVVLAVVLDGRRPGEAVEAELARVRDEVGAHCQLPLAVRLVEEIPRTRVGKHLFTVSEIATPREAPPS